MEKEIKTTEKIKSFETDVYTSPNIEVVEIEIEQNILAGGSAPDLPGEDW